MQSITENVHMTSDEKVCTLLCSSKQIIFIDLPEMLNFNIAERNPDPSLLVERRETAMLLVCEKILSRNFRPNDNAFLQLHKTFTGIMTLILWSG